nr:transposase family protein [Lentilactobacillus buchneri]
MLLGIDDEHLIIENGKIGDDGVIRLNGSLNYSPKACHNCGVINDHQIIGYGWRKTTIRFAKTLGSTVILCLNRRNFHCKACHTNFLAQTNAVPKHCTISNTTRKQCLEKLTEPVSLKHIADELSTSDSFVGRQLLRAERDFETNWHYLPKVLLMDEVKSTKKLSKIYDF